MFERVLNTNLLSQLLKVGANYKLKQADKLNNNTQKLV